MIPPPPPLPSVIQDAAGHLSTSGTPAVEEEVISAARKVYKRCHIERNKGILYHNKIQMPLIQDGPKCGIVALCMATQLWNCTVSVDDAMKVAITEGFTNCGEMFSADSMVELATRLCPCKGRVARDWDTQSIIRHIGSGQPVLVPYDADCNHEPCQKNGHKAHWVFLSGILLLVTDETKSAKNYANPDDIVPQLYLSDKSDIVTESLDSIVGVYVIGWQGKSRHACIWELSTLQSSNQQLRELGSLRENDGNMYVLPRGGIQEGLCGKAVFLQKL